MSEEILISCVIPASAKDAESQNLKDLIASIKAQDFPQDKIEILVITEGDSESAKGIGIKRAKGKIIGMFCADNELMNPLIFKLVKRWLDNHPGVRGYYSHHYFYNRNDNSLNRYFSLMGNNDPIPFYLDKADRRPHYEDNGTTMYDMVKYVSKIPSLGDNGFFVKREDILKGDLDHYYPMDCFDDIRKQGCVYYIRDWNSYIWHKTSDNLIIFLKKRYKYARDLYSDRTDRRWKMVDTAEDRWRLAHFILCTVTVLPCLFTSIRGWKKVPDIAWFWHWPVCFGFFITYSILAFRNLIKYGRFFQCPQK